MIRFCVFDLDGTTVNTLNDLCACVNLALEENGLPTKTVEELLPFIGYSTAYMCEHAIDEDKREACFPAVFDAYNRHYAKHFCDHSLPYDKMPALIARLQKEGIQTALVSNKPHRFAVRMIEALYPRDSFCMVLGMLPKFTRKPDPEPLNFVLHQVGFLPEETLYIGDSEVDIAFAKNAGIPCLSVTWGFRTKEQLLAAGAETLCDTPEELLDKILSY